MRNLLALVCGLAVTAVGCGGTSGSGGPTEALKEQVALQDIGEIYRVYTTTNNKPPGKLADLKPLRNIGATGIQALESGEIIVRYGATMTEVGEGSSRGSSDEILAYEKKAPESGGLVLMLDRVVKKMTPEEFKAAAKAGKG